MIKIENAKVFNFEGALSGMRNPLESYSQSDSQYNKDYLLIIGEKDLSLAQRLIKSGTDDSKFMRQIFVSMDITAPLYFWKEADQYKVGTVTDSCSTMHSIHKNEFTLDDFSWDQLLNTGMPLFSEEIAGGPFKRYIQPLQFLEDYIIPSLNVCREEYLRTKDKKYWWQMIQLLPSSYNQKRTWTGNYQVLRAMYFARRNHRLDEWREFCKTIETFPYAEELICYE